ncbi:hypothetical protein LTR84_003391 [Exophiala bonariae]|uniref:Uncharacterized protein n=1 Tax=Exophiala bonariae TaxID=1690606 RepID=A0AAV9NBF9_9EURO|nr:hypothetical protein LTR84_003391 [Exophiala bonariae]
MTVSMSRTKERTFEHHGNSGYAPVEDVKGRQPKYRDLGQTQKSKWKSQKWTSPAVMLSCFALGLLFAVGHHFYYRWLDGQVVGNTTRQQWSLRIGSFFALATAASLKVAMANACMQYIWLRLRQRYHKMETIDAAFTMTVDISPFFHSELYKNMHIGVVIAILIWTIPVASIFPPATLSVAVRSLLNTSSFDVLQPSIAAPNPLNQYGKDPSETVASAYMDAPNIFATLVKSTAFSGKIAAPQALVAATNYSYTLETHIPRFKCAEKPNGSARQLDSAQIFVEPLAEPLTSFNKDTFEYVNGQFAENGVENAGTGLIFYFGVAILEGNDLDGRDLETIGFNKTQVIFDMTSEELISRPYRGAFSGSVEIAVLTNPGRIKFVQCDFYNSSFTTEIFFDNGIGETRVLSVKDFGRIQNFTQDSGMPASYLHYFLEMSKFLTGGTVAQDTIENWADPMPFRVVYSRFGPDSTILATASDFSQMLHYRNDWVSNATYTPSPPPPATNVTFADMFNELSINVSLSLMSTASLSRTTSVTGNISTIQTVYEYRPENLFISYGTAIFCSLISLLVGIIAYQQNGEGHDVKVSTIGAMMQNPELAPLLRRSVDATQSGSVGDSDSSQLRLRLGTYPGPDFVGRNYVGFVQQEGPDTSKG